MFGKKAKSGKLPELDDFVREMIRRTSIIEANTSSLIDLVATQEANKQKPNQDALLSLWKVKEELNKAMCELYKLV